MPLLDSQLTLADQVVATDPPGRRNPVGRKKNQEQEMLSRAAFQSDINASGGDDQGRSDLSTALPLVARPVVSNITLSFKPNRSSVTKEGRLLTFPNILQHRVRSTPGAGLGSVFTHASSDSSLEPLRRGADAPLNCSY